MKQKQFTNQQRARLMAREQIGQPPATRKIQDKRRKPPKHKKGLSDDN